MTACPHALNQGGVKGGPGGPGPPPIDMLGPPNQQAYYCEDSGFCASFQTLVPPDKRLAPLNRLLCRRLCTEQQFDSLALCTNSESDLVSKCLLQISQF